jgi:hypothetical protein
MERSLGYFMLGVGSFVLASLAAEWASRKVWPRPVGQ